MWPLLACAATSAAGQTGAFVVTLGRDTIQVERFERRGNRVEGSVVTRSPITVVRRYQLELSPSGELERYEVRLLTPQGDPLRASGQAAAMWRDRDSLTRVTFQGDQPVTHRMAAPISLMPGPNVPYTGAPVLLYELGFALARRAANPDGSALYHDITFVPTQTRPAATQVWFIGADSVELDYFGVARRGFKLDAAGRLIRADWSASTYKYRMDRLSDLDVDSIARRWGAADAIGQAMGPISPRDTMRASVGSVQLTVAYSRPATRGRRIWGALVPWDTIWRFGADFATHLTLSGDLLIGATRVPAGRYTLWMVPSERAVSLLVVNSRTDVFGTSYDPTRDLARIPLERMPSSALADRFTLAVENNRFWIRWDNGAWSVPLSVPGVPGRHSPAPDQPEP
jgi:hypothetical protein